MKFTKQIIAIAIVLSMICSTQCMKEEESVSQQIRNFGTFILQHVELISQNPKTEKKSDVTAEKKDDATAEKKEETPAEKKEEAPAEKKEEAPAEKKEETPAEGADKKADARLQSKKDEEPKKTDEKTKKDLKDGPPKPKQNAEKTVRLQKSKDDDATKSKENTLRQQKSKDDDATKSKENALKTVRQSKQKSTNNKKTKEDEVKAEGEAKTEGAEAEKKTEGAEAEKKTEGAEAEKKTEGTEAEAKTEGAEAEKKPAEPVIVPFFKGQKIELPKYCKAEQANNKLSKQELVSIAQDAKKFVGGWNKASGEESPFNNLKDLDEKQFAQFYKEITTGLPDQPQTIKSTEAEAQSKDLLISVLFGDDKRTSVSWLEFWIYMCSGGIKPSTSQYLKSTVGKTTKPEKVEEKKPEEAARMMIKKNLLKKKMQ